MNFNQNQLPNFVLTNLYTNSLVIINEQVEEKQSDTVSINEPLKQNPIAFLGENKKQIVLLVNEENAVFITDEQYSFMSNLLTACKLNMADVALINLYNINITYHQLQQQFTAKNVVLFNISTSQIQLPFSIPHYQLQDYAGCKFMVANSINDFMQTTQQAKLLKSKLWVCLKNMFNI